MDERSAMLGNEKIWRLLIKLSVPAMIGMIVQALYNVVDTIFVGQGVGVMAIAGISVAFPIQMMVMAFSQMFGIGGASIISRSLGEGNVEKAEKTMGNVFALVLIMSAIISVLGSIFVEPLLRLFGATDEILPYAAAYISIILKGTIFFSFSMASNNIVRSEGNAKTAMTTMLISAGLNLILDPIFIFDTVPVLNIPGLDLGIRGGALATVISQATTAIYLTFYFLRGKSTVSFSVKNLKLEFAIVKEIITIGFASFTRQIASSLMAIAINNSLATYGGSMSIAVYGVIMKLLQFSVMPLLGIVQGLQPIIGFNFGAKQLERVKEGIKLGIAAAVTLATVAYLAIMIFPEAIISIFSDDAQLQTSGVHAVRVVMLVMPLVGFQVVGASYFQAVGKAIPSLILSMSRQILFLIPLVLILPLFFELEGVWVAFPTADILSIAVTFFVLRRDMKILNQQIESGKQKER